MFLPPGTGFCPSLFMGGMDKELKNELKSLEIRLTEKILSLREDMISLKTELHRDLVRWSIGVVIGVVVAVVLTSAITLTVAILAG